MSKLPGITRQAEEQRLKDTIGIAEGKLERTRQDVKNLAEELHEMLEVYDENDKEAMTLWNNTDARFKEVNQELRRAEQARKKPYFGRIDFMDKQIGKEEAYYIGRSVIAKDPAHPEVIDWRAPVAGVYYDSSLGDAVYSVKGEGRFEVKLFRKRTYEIEQDVLKDFYDSDVVANDELLTKYLAKNKKAVLGEIIATIQKEQNEAIRKKPQHNMIIQGAAGSGKTTVAMHRISYILYNYELEFAPQDFYIIGSNQVLLNYITGVLPELNVYGVSQMTMEQLFIRLLYEDWDKKYTVKPVVKGVTSPVKGTAKWFQALEGFCERYEREVIPRRDVVIEKNGTLLLSGAAIEKILKRSRHLSRADKISRLTEHLIAKLENEISGKYYSYQAEEKKRLKRFYENYFGKREWKGSIFEMYDSFLLEQADKGIEVELPGTAFDVYDLAALAYLYKRIKETEIIREAGHVVIDEAQDFGMMAYCALKYCLSKCTYTIMGDVAQNISLDYGLNDWEELRELMLPDEFDYFGLLQKSYRNTVEISRFATDILHHGSFQVYPVQPIIRHGKEVRVTSCGSYEALIEETVSTVKGWQREGKDTIAIVCGQGEEAKRVTKSLAGRIELLPNDPASLEFHTGVMVLPLEYTKGLEFDAVLIFDASVENYPSEDGYVKRLYVAATRALHELAVLYQGKLTGLIANPVSRDKLKEAVIEPSKTGRKPLQEEPEKTRAELYIQQAREGAKEMDERNQIGPKRIVVKQKQTSPVSEGKKTGMRVKITGDAATVPAYLERRKKELAAPESAKLSGEFGGMPDSKALRPAGHARIDCSVRLCMKGPAYYDLISGYGTLRITPISPEIIRICFLRGQGGAFPEVLEVFKRQNVRHKYRDSRDAIELLTERVLVRVDKKTGAVAFLTPQGKQLLSERSKEPRQVGEHQVWLYFDWDKGENLIARGRQDEELLQIGMSARYISFGEESGRMPALASGRGYELLLPPGHKALCCNIAMYGPYLSVEGTELIDYYFKMK
ncbi:MAG: AAA family ATPase [Roseburia sp.]|nr:AAA family ATPase [Roseburia sp.]